MTFVRRSSFEHLSPQQCSPIYSSEEISPTNYKPEEAIHYLTDFLDANKLQAAGGDGVRFYSRLFSSSTSFTLQELKARDVLEQELKMKQEQAAKDTCLMQSTHRRHGMTTNVKIDKPSMKRAASPDSSGSGRRYRTHFTSTQLDLLETTFQAAKYPSSSLRTQVQEMTGIPKDNIKVWFQNRRAREKRRKEKSKRLGVHVPSEEKRPATVTTTPSPPQPVAMTTISMHWPEDTSSTISSSTVSSVPPPTYHPYQNQWNTPTMQNRRNWYWANAYQPLEPPCSTSSSAAPSSMNSSAGMPYSLPQIPGHVSNFVKSEPTSLPAVGLPLSLPTAISPVGLPVSVQPESLVNSTDNMHPWSDSVLASL
ncbi:uncharacterized protein [Amphiura filiformis]|uniref:uncharacterized protein n=1 Tax=Amphiura filiformis TaxID=82378 RepID=UPI003B21EAFE